MVAHMCFYDKWTEKVRKQSGTTIPPYNVETTDDSIPEDNDTSSAPLKTSNTPLALIWTMMYVRAYTLSFKTQIEAPLIEGLYTQDRQDDGEFLSKFHFLLYQ